MTIPRWFVWVCGVLVSLTAFITAIAVRVLLFALAFSQGQARVENEFRLLRYTLCAADSIPGPRSYYCDPNRSVGVATYLAPADATATTLLRQVDVR